MTVQPDHIRFYHPAEDGDQPRTLHSEYTDYTDPDGPYTVMDEAMHIVLRHVQQWWGDCDEDLFVRYCCLVADLGYRVDEHGFYELVDDYTETMTSAQADQWNATLRTFLAPHTEETVHG